MSGAPEPRALLEAAFAAALASVDPAPRVREALYARPVEGPVRLLAAGKAALPMARAARTLLAAQGRAPRESLVVLPALPEAVPGGLRLTAGSHPVPDARSRAAGEAALALAARCRPEETLLVLLSGGASALLTAPQAPLTLADLAASTQVLLRAGAPIEVLNAFRRHVTRVSGGRLALATAARCVRVLAVSDVAGDDPSVLASGPCSADPTRFADARAGIASLGAYQALPAAVRAHLEAGERGERAESAKPGDPALARVELEIVASLADAMEAALAFGEARGLESRRVPGELAGEARLAGAALAQQALGDERSRARDELWVAGGETTVTVTGDGRGGRSQELALAAALVLQGSHGVSLLAAGTDGIDGPTDAAGGFVDGGSVARGRARGRDARGDLARNDAYGFLAAAGGLFRPGPTGTNVRDLVLLHRTAGRGRAAGRSGGPAQGV